MHYTSTFNTTFTTSNGRTTTYTETKNIPDWVNTEETRTNTFDADGRITNGADTYTFDADGRLGLVTYSNSPSETSQEMIYDGDGNLIKVVRDGVYPDTVFRINSVVIGKEIARVWGSGAGGNQRQTKIYGNGHQIAERRMMFIGSGNGTQPELTAMIATDPSGAEIIETPIHAVYGYGFETLVGGGTLDPFGAAVGYENPYPTEPPVTYEECGRDGEHYACDIDEDEYPDPENENSEVGSISDNTCYVNGFKADCNLVTANPDDYEAEPEFAPENKYKHPGLYFGHTNSGVTNWVDDEDTGSVDFETNTVNIQAHGHLETNPQPKPAPTPPNGGKAVDIFLGKDTESKDAAGIACLIRAFMDTLAWAEGSNYRTVAFGTVQSSPNYPELVGQKNVSIPGPGWPADHPNILVGPQYPSTAAGRYQILYKTWQGSPFAGKDFTPTNQDAYAVWQLQNLGVPNQLYNGNLKGATDRSKGTWASVPGATYKGQKPKTMADFTNHYNSFKAGC